VPKCIVLNDLAQALETGCSRVDSSQTYDVLTHRSRGFLGMVEMEDRWLSITEICKYLGVSNDTVYKWIDKHGMPAHRMGRLWKFKKDEVDEWVKAGGADQTNANQTE